MTPDVVAYRAIERIRMHAERLDNTDYSQADLDGLATDVSDALDAVADALDAIRESIPK